MAFTPKDWRNDPETSTPLSAAALEDMETRLAAYTDAVSAGTAGTLVTPVFSPALTTTPSALAQNRIYYNRVVIPKDGTLSGLAIWVATQSGNLDIGVYDTGDASAGNRTLLASSGATAVPTAGAWTEVYTPNLTVVAGEHYDLAVQFDNSTVSAGRIIMGASPAAIQLPAGYLDAPGGANTKLIGFYSAAGFGLPGTISEANMGAPGTLAVAYIIGRIT